MRSDRVRLGFVVPRYGPEIVGGAETLARGFAQRLAEDRYEVDVLTTCARDHHTWRNVLPSGPARDGRVNVRRFPVSPRNVERFLALQQRLSEGFPLSVDEELEWASSSVNSEELYGYLDAESERYDALLFLPYLFGTTILGSQIAPRRSVLIPCLHDEPFAYLKVVAHMFRSVCGTLFNSAPERSLARRLFGTAPRAPVVGFGFEPVARADEDAAAFRARRGIAGDYLLYFGRKEGGKNLPLLLENFRGCRDAGRGLSLVIAGDGSLDPASRGEGLVDLPRLDEEEKRAACAGALALCQPSVNESFSIVIMEAWLQETPVLVNGRCAVTSHHVTLSNGGLCFEDAVEFAAEVDYLRRHRSEARELGRQGRQYVVENYTWDRVLVRFEDALRDTLGIG
jgi:glycosyltransferase involved in cell wall biosynthesis